MESPILLLDAIERLQEITPGTGLSLGVPKMDSCHWRTGGPQDVKDSCTGHSRHVTDSLAIADVENEMLSFPVDCWKEPHLITKLQLVRGQHDDVIIDGQHSLCLDLIVREETITQLVFCSPHNLQGNTDFGPQRFWKKNKKRSYHSPRA